MPTRSAPGTEPRSGGEWGASLVAPSLLWLVAFVIFLRHHDYPLLGQDASMAALQVAIAGLAPGIVLAFAPRALRAIAFAGALLIFLDLQTSWLQNATGLWLGTGLALAIGWFGHALLGRATAFVSVVMIASTLPLAPGGGWVQEVTPKTEPAAAATTPREPLPPILHLILDEHIATGAIPEAFDLDAKLRHRIEGSYLARGFRVFPHAFGRHYTTGPALSHLLNLSAGSDSLAFYDPEEDRVTRNAWFRLLAGRGYRVRVLQTDYLDFCQPDEPVPIDTCITYTLESIKAIEGSGMQRADRTRALLGSFGQLSHGHQRLRKAYLRWQREEGGDAPPWPLRAGRLSTVASRLILPRAEQALAATRAGEITFVHLLLPHFPYAYDAACKLRPSPLEWRSYKETGLRGAHNDAASRAERFPLYLEQVECTRRLVGEMLGRLLALPQLEDAWVIVHGDHGPRLNRFAPVVPNLDRLDERDYLDAFAAHFAVRGPGVARGVDRRQASLDALLRVIAQRGGIPQERDDWIGSTRVHLVGEQRDASISRPMPTP